MFCMPSKAWEACTVLTPRPYRRGCGWHLRFQIKEMGHGTG